MILQQTHRHPALASAATNTSSLLHDCTTTTTTTSSKRGSVKHAMISGHWPGISLSIFFTHAVSQAYNINSEST